MAILNVQILHTPTHIARYWKLLIYRKQMKIWIKSRCRVQLKQIHYSSTIQNPALSQNPLTILTANTYTSKSFCRIYIPKLLTVCVCIMLLANGLNIARLPLKRQKDFASSSVRMAKKEECYNRILYFCTKCSLRNKMRLRLIIYYNARAIERGEKTDY